LNNVTTLPTNAHASLKLQEYFNTQQEYFNTQTPTCRSYYWYILQLSFCIS